jgi:hypothetical protein
MVGGKRNNWSHGVEVRRRDRGGPGDRRASQVLIRRICLRYEDGRRVCFVPEAGEEFFSQDDAHRVVGMLHKGAEALEWGLALEEYPGTERYPGMGPYDIGAV